MDKIYLIRTWSSYERSAPIWIYYPISDKRFPSWKQNINEAKVFHTLKTATTTLKKYGVNRSEIFEMDKKEFFKTRLMNNYFG